MDLSNRELAALFWLAVLVLFMLWMPDIRRSLFQVVRILLGPRLLVPFALYGLWMVGVVWVAARFGFWDPTLTKDSIFWVAPGFVLVFDSIKVVTERHFFLRRVVRVVGVTALVQFYVNLATLDFVWEVVLQFVIFLAAALQVVAGATAGTEPVKRLATAVLLLIFLVLLVPPTQLLLSNANTINGAAELREFLVPVWMTLGALPAVFALSLYSAYEQVFLRTRFAVAGRRVPWRTRLAVVSVFGLNNRAVQRFSTGSLFDVAHASSFAAARTAIALVEADLRAADATKKKEADDLIRYAGVKGTDDEGRQLDRREFTETADALEWLHTMQMGWYRNPESRYRPNLLEQSPEALDRFGLPKPNDIRLDVSRSGQSWFAWRRTPSGWCFAIGASGPPPNAWYYDGPEPPRGYPGRDPTWGTTAFEQGPNWMLES